jgi:hypothetical protein
MEWPLFLTILYRTWISRHFAPRCVMPILGYMVGIFVNRLGFLVSRGIVEHRVHLILQHWDIGRLRDVYWAGALGSQGLATEVKSLIWGVWRHVDQGGRINSSTSDLEASGTTGGEGVARMSAELKWGNPEKKNDRDRNAGTPEDGENGRQGAEA